ncbi:MAG: hypothetical protein JXB09_04435 [Deltaproteobacteria bacterium]|nr:hypothetical protein [Deltaproteobacteria bacterium]
MLAIKGENIYIEKLRNTRSIVTGGTEISVLGNDVPDLSLVLPPGKRYDPGPL